MREHIGAGLSRLVRHRANDCCEYCRLPQHTQEATFHLDHINPVVDGGEPVSENLALACVSCSLRKGSRTIARDPVSGRMVRLFHPREHKWEQHFRWSDTWEAEGMTANGRATVTALGMNRSAILEIRRIWAELGEFPP